MTWLLPQSLQAYRVRLGEAWEKGERRRIEAGWGKMGGCKQKVI